MYLSETKLLNDFQCCHIKLILKISNIFWDMHHTNKIDQRCLKNYYSSIEVDIASFRFATSRQRRL